MASAQKQALENLKRVADEGARLLDKLGKAAEAASSRTSEALSGLLGGGVALCGAYALSLLFPAISLLVAAPIAASVGVPAAILLWRGGKRHALESKIQDTRLLAEQVVRMATSLPTDAPREVSGSLWLTYAELASDLRLMHRPGFSKRAIAGRKQEALPPPRPNESNAPPSVQGDS